MNRIFSAKIENLYDMLNFIKQQAALAGIVEPYISKVELALEELLVNIICHAYPEKNDGEIEIQCCRKENALQIVVKDQGVPFDLVKAAQTFHPTNQPSGSTSLGGYGIYFVIKMMDDVGYERIGINNVVTMIKRAVKATVN